MIGGIVAGILPGGNLKYPHLVGSPYDCVPLIPHKVIIGAIS
jgi:hypothetical protein